MYNHRCSLLSSLRQNPSHHRTAYVSEGEITNISVRRGSHALLLSPSSCDKRWPESPSEARQASKYLVKTHCKEEEQHPVKSVASKVTPQKMTPLSPKSRRFAEQGARNQRPNKAIYEREKCTPLARTAAGRAEILTQPEGRVTPVKGVVRSTP